MKTKSTLVLIMVTLVIVVVSRTSSNAGDKKYYPVTNREPRVSSLGYSVVPPPGEKWLESFADQSIYFTKITDPKIQTFYTGATEIYTTKSFAAPSDFLAYVKEKKDFNEYPTRYQNTNNEYKIDTRFAPLCVNYTQRYEDHGAKNLGGNKFLLIASKGLICLHPDSPKVGVDVYYSERYLPNQDKISSDNEGNAFIQSLKFLPLPKKESK